MSNTKKIKKSLLLSVLSLVICCSMLLGTTFAWFTDSVTSANNIIKSGNLDVTLEYWDGDSWEDVSGKSDILTTALWEPGVTEVVYFRITNAGSLALKYQFGVNIVSETEGKNVEGETFKLSDYIMFGVQSVDGANAYETREDAIAATTEAKKISAGYTKAASMEPAGVEYLAMVVYMPTTVGNEANHNGTNVPKIDLGINIVATQYTAESDSFDNGYDKDAWADGMEVYTAEDLQAVINNGVTNIVLVEDIVVDESIVIPAPATATYSLRSTTPAVVIDLNGKTLTSAEGLTAPVIYNYGVLELKNGTIKAIETTAIRNNGAVAHLTLDAMTVSQTVATNPEWQGSAVFTANGATTVINSGNYSGISSAAIVATSGGHLVINDGTFTAVATTIRLDTWSQSSFLTINGGTFNVSVEGAKALYADGSKAADGVNINGGIFNGTLDSTYTPININGGTFNKSIKQPGGHQNYYNITGGTFVENVAAISKNTTVSDGFSAVENNDGSFIVLPGANTELVSDGFFFDGENTYYITNAAGFVAFAAEVNKGAEYEGNTFAGKTVVLMADVDFGGAEWDPIGSFGNTSKQFCGVFDGQGHTVSNFQITKKAADRAGKNRSSQGFFGNVNGTIKNLTVANANVTITDDGRFVGALIGRLNGGLVENCKVVDSHVEGSVWQIGAIVGQANAGTIQNCAVENTTVVGKAGGAAAVAGFQVDAKELNINNCTIKNCEIKQSVASYGADYDDMFAAVLGCANNAGGTISISGCTVENTTVKGVKSSAAVGYIEAGASVTVDGVKLITTAAELQAALLAGGNVVLGKDITLSQDIAISNANFVLDGNGYTISGSANIAALDITGGTATVKNVTFDGIQGGSAIRTVGVKFNASNVTVKNCVQKAGLQGLFRLLGENTIENCSFINNTCNMAVSLNYDTNDDVDPQVVNDCVFENNTCSVTAVLYYAHGTSFTANGNKFLNNTVNATGNAATVYVGFMKNATITNNLFQGNDVTGTSKRVAGGLMIGYAAKISGNAFIDNTVTGSVEGLGNDVCASVYYTDIDLSGNYWGGNAPVAGDDYYQEYTNHNVIINDYLTTYGN